MPEEIEQEQAYLQANIDIGSFVRNPETYAPEYEYTWSDLAKIKSTILPTEMSQTLLEYIENAMRHKMEADFWLQNAERWLNQD